MHDLTKQSLRLSVLATWHIVSINVPMNPKAKSEKC